MRKIPQREQVSKVDRAWLRMERPTHLMMVVATLVLAKPMTLNAFTAIIRQRLLKIYPRFQQKIVNTSKNIYWENDDDFDLEYHLRLTALPRPADQNSLHDLISSLASTPLDFSRPLWQIHLIDNYQTGCALLIRIHQTYADGMTLFNLLLSLSDTQPQADLDAHPLFSGLLQPPPAPPAKLNNQGTEVLTDITKLALMSFDPTTRFTGRSGVIKRVAWAKPIPLESFTKLNFSLEVSILSCLTGALRAYLLDNGDTLQANQNIHIALPVNLRTSDTLNLLGNQCGLILLALPLGVADKKRRIQYLQAAIKELTQSYQTIVDFDMLGALGMGPSVIQPAALDILGKTATGMMLYANLTRTALTLNEIPITEFFFWLPPVGDLNVSLSLMLYNGNLHVGIMTDKRIVPDPEPIMQYFTQEYFSLIKN